MIDSHCHLDDPKLNEQLKDVLRRAKTAGVSHMLTISTTLKTFPNVLEIASSNHHIWASVGVHPHETEEEGVPTPEILEQHAAHPKVIGIGETGLDYYYEHAKRDIQKESFRNHIRAAKKMGLPLIIHSRDAEEDILTILKEEKINAHKTPGVIHCFTGTLFFAKAAIELGFYISCSGIITFKNANDLAESITHLPLNRLLIETDAPWLAPVPYRGKINEPAFVPHVAQKLADLKGVPVEDVIKATTENFYNVFKKATREKAPL